MAKVHRGDPIVWAFILIAALGFLAGAIGVACSMHGWLR
jgi:hypothetical protein